MKIFCQKRWYSKENRWFPTTIIDRVRHRENKQHTRFAEKRVRQHHINFWIIIESCTKKSS